MELVIDASSVINLANAQALELVARVEDQKIWLPPLVIGECHSECVAELVRLKDEGLVYFVEPDQISAENYLDLLSEYDLGEGETECLVICLSRQCLFCCDDRHARGIGIQLLGRDRVVGSLRLLKWSVAARHITQNEAFVLYESMKSSGGFLPEVAETWFSDESSA